MSFMEFRGCVKVKSAVLVDKSGKRSARRGCQMCQVLLMRLLWDSLSLSLCLAQRAALFIS